jgi:hypothetical protein
VRIADANEAADAGQYGAAALLAAKAAGTEPSLVAGSGSSSGSCGAVGIVNDEIIAGQRENVPAMYPLRSSPPRASSNLLAALVRRLKRVCAPHANRARDRPKNRNSSRTGRAESVLIPRGAAGR